MNSSKARLKYAAIHHQVDSWLDVLADTLGEHPKGGDLRAKALELGSALRADGSLRIALLGEFNAGKSSIIAALTGEDVVIDADVATQVARDYAWHGLLLTDTPGIQAEKGPTDHDEIARSATVNADLVLFVLTNELFKPRLVEHFQFVAGADGLGLSEEMALVVNKMDRESNHDEVIVTEVAAAVSPHSNVPVLLLAAKKALDAQRDDLPPNLRGRFVQQGRLQAFIDDLDLFVKARGVMARLTTPLQVGEELLDEASRGLVADGADATELELLRRKEVALRGSRKEAMRVIRTHKEAARTKVLRQLEVACSGISETSAPEDIETAFDAAIETVRPELDGCATDLVEGLRTVVENLSDSLSEVDGSELAATLGARQVDAGRAALEGISAPPKRRASQTRGAKAVLEGGIREGLEKIAKDPKGLKKLVYTVGKKLGKKFRPWEATKSGKSLARGAGKFAKAVPFLAAALEFYINVREEKEREARQRHVARARLAVAKALREQALLEAEAIDGVGQHLLDQSVGKAERSLEAQRADLLREASEDKAYAARLSDLRSSARRVRDQVHVPEL